MAVWWTGEVPARDDLGRPLRGVMYDARTRIGPWALLCQESYDLVGMGLGVGLGQRYEQQPDGRWLQTAGGRE